MKEAFPELFRIACNRNAQVADFLRFHNGVMHWDLSFICSIQDWELESLAYLMDLLYTISRHGIGEDSILWGPNKGKYFTVRSYYRAL